MAQPTIQTSFGSGEWAPKLRARVDIQKYKSGAAYMRNFYVDYSGGGASTRQGTKFINQCKSLGARLIPFQPSTTLSYVLEFGQNYIRFYSNGAPIVEAATTISGATKANPGVITDNAHGYATGDWVLITGVVGMTQLNGNYYIVVKTGANTYTLTDLNGNAIDTTGYSAYVSGGKAQRVYTISSPYITSDLFPNALTDNPGIKFVQDVTSLIICHPTYPPQILTIISATNWTLTAINFAPTIASPTNLAFANAAPSANGVNATYGVTAVDGNGQESALATVQTGDCQYIWDSGHQTVFTVTWNAVPGAVSYNVYRTQQIGASVAIPSGAQFGFMGNVTGTTFNESFGSPVIGPDFAQGPPILQNPFAGGSVQSLLLGTNANYTTVPTFIIDPPGAGVQASGYVSLSAYIVGIANAGGGYAVNQVINLNVGGLSVLVTSVGGGGAITGASVVNGGSVTVGTTPSNPITDPTMGALNPAQFNFTWHIGALVLVQGGEGYTTVPNVTFSAGAATATAVLGSASLGNPGVPAFIQERLMFAAQPQGLQSYNLSQPNSFFNFNISNPSQDDDAISGTIISEELNDIRNLVPVPTGIIAFTGRGAWLINGGGGISTQTPITPSNQTAQPQGFNGANDLKPIKINMDALYGTNKGNYVRDLTYNLYAQIFTGSDITTFSNHLFFGFYMPDWAWSEEPFKTLWCVRSDGQMLSLCFVKEQELIGWAHHDTNGQFMSVCSVIENVSGNVVDAVYCIVQRQVNGNTVQYVERMADRYFPYGYEDAWSVDCALQTLPFYSGQPSVPHQNTSADNFTLTVTGGNSGPGIICTWSSSLGLNNTNIGQVVRVGGGVGTITAVNSTSQVVCNFTQAITAINLYTGIPWPNTLNWTYWIPLTTVTSLTQLIGQSVVGLADGVPVGPFVVSATGSVALGLTATKIILGLAYLPQLQTLPLDLGEPTVQGKRKKITGVTVRVADTLGLSIGKSFASAVPMKDFTLGNVPTTSTGPASITGLVNGDGRTIIDQAWDEAGNYCIQQTLPYPATILGAMPEISMGDTK